MTKTADEIEKDKALIKQNGGVTKFATLLGLDKKGGAQRVANWRVRGIPDSVKAGNPQIFEGKHESA